MNILDYNTSETERNKENLVLTSSMKAVAVQHEKLKLECEDKNVAPQKHKQFEIH